MSQTRNKSKSEPPEEIGGEEQERGGRRERLRESRTQKADRRTGEQLEQARDVAAEMRHQRDCPVDGSLPGDPGSRVEHFSANRPNTPDLPESKRGEPLIVVRCIECGEAEVVSDESEE